MSTHGSPIPFDAPADGTAVLIRGPPMSGKFDLLLRTLATGHRGLALSTGKSVDTVRDTYAKYGDPATLAVVDCATGHGHEATGGEQLVRHASSPQNLTELGVKFTDLVETIETDEVVVGLHSLSELLMYWDPQRIYQFTRVLLGQVHDLGWGAVAVLDDTACDEQVVHTLTEPFDVLVDTRRNDDGRELRVQRSGDARTAWIEF